MIDRSEDITHLAKLKMLNPRFSPTERVQIRRALTAHYEAPTASTYDRLYNLTWGR